MFRLATALARDRPKSLLHGIAINSNTPILLQTRLINIGDYGPRRVSRSSLLKKERSANVAQIEEMISRVEAKKAAGVDTKVDTSAIDTASTTAPTDLDLGNNGDNAKSVVDWRAFSEDDAYQAVYSNNDSSKVNGGYISMRLSDEETLALLDEAGQSIPDREGPRRSRYLKREKNRWRAVRQLNQHKKIEKMHANIRKDLGRQRRLKEVKYVLETAEETRRIEAEYRSQVMMSTISVNTVNSKK